MSAPGEAQHGVAGESLDALAPAFAKIRMRGGPSRMVRLDMEIPVEEALPFQRALMRLEAELLLEDADNLTEPGVAVRTVEQRRVDALVTLARRVVDATEGHRHPPTPGE